MVIFTNNTVSRTVRLVERKILKYTANRILTSRMGLLFVAAVELAFGSDVPPEKLTAAQLVKKFHAF